MNYAIRGIHPTDAVRFIARPGDWLGWSRPEEMRQEDLALLDEDGEPVALWWLGQRWPGSADLWGMVSDQARRHPRTFIRTCDILLTNRIYEWQLERVNTLVATDNLVYRRFAIMLGFEPEFTMPRAGPGGTDLSGYVRWACSTSSGAAGRLRQ